MSPSSSPTTSEHSELDLAYRDTGLPSAQLQNDLSVTLKRAREEERKKGKAVEKQLTTSDSLLDARIRLQKCITSMNRLPDSKELPLYLAKSGSRDAADRFLCEALALSVALTELQEKLMTSIELREGPNRKRRKIDDPPLADCDWEERLDESMRQFTQLESMYHPTLLSTLQKWSNKVLAIVPSALLPLNRTKFSRSNVTQTQTAVQLVDEALLDREKLVWRTRTMRSTAARLRRTHDHDTVISAGSPGEANFDADIFDDTDFYQSLLREVVEGRAGGINDGDLAVLSTDWRAAQRQRKMSKVVDTRASKGRKLRFEFHEKLQNFMVPAPSPNSGSWHEEQTDELFASLLGKGFCVKVDDSIGINGQVEAKLDAKTVVGDTLKVFS